MTLGSGQTENIQIHMHAYLRIFSLTTSQSQKLIPKADLKWECQDYYSKKKLERLGRYF